ncbi:MAG: PaaI family thioesterase [Chloroflexi bacterium]|nr:PaaI family thioesterase [Chloroflexota bacterium]
MQPLPTTKSCFVCGSANPIGLQLHFETDGAVVRTRFVPRPEHAGFKRTVHGGIISTILDEVMVWACGVRTQRFAYCAELTVRFLHPARPGQSLLATGELVTNRRNRLFEAQGELRNQADLVLATAKGKYLPLKDQEMKEAMTDFDGDVSGLFG